MSLLKTDSLNIEKKIIKIGFLNKKKFLIYTLSGVDYYLEINNTVILSKIVKNFLSISQKAENSNVLSFFSGLNLVYNKILQLKGLGLKAYILKKDSQLFLKLGFSHILKISYDSDILIKVRNNFIFLQSYNKIKLGNFAAFIKSLKKPDSYKGKGVWYKNESKKLKIVKKK